MSSGDWRDKCAEDDRIKQRRVKTSGSILFSEAKRTFRSIPLFSYDAGVVLRPELVQLLCGYGIDGSTDDNKPQCGFRGERLEERDTACVPGCGDPPDWCDPDNHASRYGGNSGGCGFDWEQSGIRPWRSEDLGELLDTFADTGAEYSGIGDFKGYNEVVISSDPWIDALPNSVEAIFLIDCEPGQKNLAYGGGGGLASSCEEAHARGREMHAAYLAECTAAVASTSFSARRARCGTCGPLARRSSASEVDPESITAGTRFLTDRLDPKDFPLLMLRPGNFVEPFVELL